MGISAVIITKNEVDRLGPCLESVSWTDEILVSDSFSTDGTVELAKQFKAQVFQEPWKGYSAQKNALIERARHEWIFSIDADERVTEELVAEIQAVVHGGQVDGLAIPRRSFFMGRWIRGSGWYPDYQVRVFRKGKGRFQPKRVHEGVVVEGALDWLTSDLLHYPYRDLAHYFDKFNEYTTLAAQDLRDRGVAFNASQLFSHPFAVFVKSYVLKRGWRDGVPGFAIAGLAALNTFVKYGKLWELTHEDCSPKS